MAETHEHQAVTKAFSGLGLDEKALISILGKWKHEHKHSYRQGTRDMFIPDEREFEKFHEDEVARITHEILRFKNAVVLWAMHPWERDARFLKEALTGREASNVIIEIACTRSADELLGARKAYHSLFDHSIEEDVASNVRGHERKLLVSLVSAYRYEGPRVKEEVAKSEAKELHQAIKNPGKNSLVEDDEVGRILSTRSKLHLKSVYKHYKELFGTYLDQDLQSDLNSSLRDVVLCLCAPEIYFSEALDAALKKGADEFTQQALTRVIVCQADVNMKEIKDAYHQRYGVQLSQKIEETAQGNYKDLLLTLLARD
uniref:Peroxidase n=1 Tax=Opuntia streptacantha TaxID=393608 RepID=A0A7C8ZVB8_OPUST